MQQFYIVSQVVILIQCYLTLIQTKILYNARQNQQEITAMYWSSWILFQNLRWRAGYCKSLLLNFCFVAFGNPSFPGTIQWKILWPRENWSVVSLLHFEKFSGAL